MTGRDRWDVASEVAREAQFYFQWLFLILGLAVTFRACWDFFAGK